MKLVGNTPIGIYVIVWNRALVFLKWQTREFYISLRKWFELVKLVKSLVFMPNCGDTPMRCAYAFWK